MSETYERLKASVFSGDLPHFSQQLQEYWNVAILLRRKYLERQYEAIDALFEDIICDLKAINEAYGYNETVLNLTLEVYDDIVRQVDPDHQNSRTSTLIHAIAHDYTKSNQSDAY